MSITWTESDGRSGLALVVHPGPLELVPGLRAELAALDPLPGVTVVESRAVVRDVEPEELPTVEEWLATIRRIDPAKAKTLLAEMEHEAEGFLAPLRHAERRMARTVRAVSTAAQAYEDNPVARVRGECAAPYSPTPPSLVTCAALAGL